MSALSDQELRERCLDMALRQTLGDPVEQARRYFEFVKGDRSPRDRIIAALDQAGVS